MTTPSFCVDLLIVQAQNLEPMEGTYARDRLMPADYFMVAGLSFSRAKGDMTGNRELISRSQGKMTIGGCISLICSITETLARQISIIK